MSFKMKVLYFNYKTVSFNGLVKINGGLQTGPDNLLIIIVIKIISKSGDHRTKFFIILINTEAVPFQPKTIIKTFI